MGQEIDRWRFSEADYRAFVEKVAAETAQLASWEQQGCFKTGPTTVGYELEACLVDNEYRPADANDEFLRRLAMPEVVPELARCNIEFNGHPHVLEGSGLGQLHHELDSWLKRAREVAQGLNLRLIMIGILPTLTEDGLSMRHISDSNRFQAINHALEELRGRKRVHMQIRSRPHSTMPKGQEYHGEFDSIMAESAATSFQLHLRLPDQSPASWYNAALLASAPVLSVSANAPFLFGYDLWAETRIPVFAQAVDTGKYHYVSFGQGYLNNAISELFERNLHHFPPLLPVSSQLSGLPHLKLHNGIVWRWNRAIVDGDSEGSGDLHYRLEHRCLPSGPSSVDMVANAAFFWGLVSSLRTQQPELSFRQVRRNFYRAARDGMASRLLWVDGHEYPAKKLVTEILLPLARKGLSQLNVNGNDIQLYLDVVRQRAERGLSGAGWQRAWLRRHGGDIGAMLAAYERGQWSGKPVAEWKI